MKKDKVEEAEQVEDAPDVEVSLDLTDTKKTRDDYLAESKQQIMQKFGEAQAVLLLGKTPEKLIKRRLLNPSKPKGPGNPEFEYIPHAHVEQTLNWAFQLQWDAVVTKTERVGTSIIVEGYIEATFPNGGKVKKSGFGGAVYIENNRAINWADSYKAAYSDMIKNAATKLGLGLDLYLKDEKRYEQTVNNPKNQTSDVGKLDQFISIIDKKAPKNKRDFANWWTAEFVKMADKAGLTGKDRNVLRQYGNDRLED